MGSCLDAIECNAEHTHFFVCNTTAIKKKLVKKINEIHVVKDQKIELKNTLILIKKTYTKPP